MYSFEPQDGEVVFSPAITAHLVSPFVRRTRNTYSLGVEISILSTYLSRH